MALVVPATLSVLVSVWMETFLFGINVVIYFICLHIFISRKTHKNSGSQRGLLIISALLFLSATAHVSVNLRRLIEGYVLPSSKAEMMKYLVDIRQPTDIVKQYLVVSTTLFSDLIIIWRVHIVWGFDWRISAIPSLLSIGVLASGLGSATSIALAKPGQTVFFKLTSSFGTALACLSLAMNLTSTALIASRIWWVTRGTQDLLATSQMSASFPSSSNPSFSSMPAPRTARFGNGRFSSWKSKNRQYWRLIVLIVESAVLAALVQVVGLSFVVAKFPGVYFLADMNVQIMAMTPLIIIAFVGLSNSSSSSAWTSSTSYESWGSTAKPDHWVERAPAPGRARKGASSMKFATPLDTIDLEARNGSPGPTGSGKVMGVAI